MPELSPSPGADGSYSLRCGAVGEGFHGPEGALAEARAKFVEPAELGRFPAGRTLRVVEVAVGTGTNTAVLIRACRAAGLALRWWGLELDPEPQRLALGDPGFRRQWPAPVLAELEARLRGTTLLWGDARRRIVDLPPETAGGCDLVLLDAFSPRRCPQLWSQEFLADLVALLAPAGRLITYCSAAAVRGSLARLGLQVAAIRSPGSDPLGRWSLGSVAAPCPLPASARLRPLSPMEREHLQTRAAEPYRDPQRSAGSAEILEARRRRQSISTAASTSRWRRRWGLEHGR